MASTYNIEEKEYLSGRINDRDGYIFNYAEWSLSFFVGFCG